MTLSHRRAPCVALLLVAITCASSATAAELELPRDGWASWHIDTPDGAPAWCCFGDWRQGSPVRTTCRLDENSHGFGTRRDNETTDSARVYARFAGGKLERLQVLAAHCPVETRTPIRELEGVAVDDSARWTIAQAKGKDIDVVTREPIAEGALAALALHRGKFAGDALADFARQDARSAIRERSAFWLALMRGEEGAAVTSSVMFADRDTNVRRHAAFAMSLSKASRVVPDLIRLANSDPAAEVRGHAWFSLALTKSDKAEPAIQEAIRKDRDGEVREQAVFALSRLPEERATRALIAVAEDQALPRETRKRAVFWLSHSESDAARSYLEGILALR